MELDAGSHMSSSSTVNSCITPAPATKRDRRCYGAVSFCVPRVPVYMSAADVCHFFAPFYSDLTLLRLVNHANHRNTLALLLRVRSQHAALNIAHSLHNKPFNSLSDAKCSLLQLTRFQLLPHSHTKESSSTPCLAVAAAVAAAVVSPNAQSGAHHRNGNHDGRNLLDGNHDDPDGILSVQNGKGGSSICSDRRKDGSNYGQLKSENGAPVCIVGNGEPAVGGDGGGEWWERAPDNDVCPVCLEGIEVGKAAHGAVVVVTVCNHGMHATCLAKWGDNCCPLCRFSQQPTPESDSCLQCATAATNSNAKNSSNGNQARKENTALWMCLVCGNVGCGGVGGGGGVEMSERMRTGHSYEHFVRTSHTFAAAMGHDRTAVVWDFAAGEFVHRLAASSVDGKLVELRQYHRHQRYQNPNRNRNQRQQQERRGSVQSLQDSVHTNTTTAAAAVRRSSSNADSNTDDDHDDDDDKRDDDDDCDDHEEFEWAKESALWSEYEALVEAQLGEQRAYFETVRVDEERAAASARARVELELERVRNDARAVKTTRAALETRKHDLKARLHRTAQLLHGSGAHGGGGGIQGEIGAVGAINASVRENLEEYKRGVRDAAKQREVLRARRDALQSELVDKYAQIDAAMCDNSSSNNNNSITKTHDDIDDGDGGGDGGEPPDEMMMTMLAGADIVGVGSAPTSPRSAARRARRSSASARARRRS